MFFKTQEDIVSLIEEKKKALRRRATSVVPYIGISNVQTTLEVSNLIKAFSPFESSSHQLCISAELHREMFYRPDDVAFKTFPRKESLAYMFGLDPGYKCLQYIDVRSRGFRKDLCRAILYGGVGLDAIQLDIHRPNPDDIARGVEDAGQKIEVILRLENMVLNDCIKNILQTLKNYKGIIHRVFLNKGGGRGFPFLDAHHLESIVRAIKDTFGELGIIIAGGLDIEKIYRLKGLLTTFPDLSIDAQGVEYPYSKEHPVIHSFMARKYFSDIFSLYGIDLLKDAQSEIENLHYIGRQ